MPTFSKGWLTGFKGRFGIKDFKRYSEATDTVESNYIEELVSNKVSLLVVVIKSNYLVNLTLLITCILGLYLVAAARIPPLRLI